MSERAEQLAAWVRERFPDVGAEPLEGIDMDGIVVGGSGIADVCTALRDEAGFDVLSDLSAVDRHPADPRFEVNYHLFAMQRSERLRLKIRLSGAEPSAPSVTGVWPTADWQEREVFDFFGVVFTGHPNLARLFMPDEWEGHPLRKDYPVGGVPVEYRVEPAYVGQGHRITESGLAAAGGPPPRLTRDRGRRSLWTWTGPPAAGVRRPAPPEAEEPSDG
jgi:NADH-quinone oxidoreductase subunit C